MSWFSKALGLDNRTTTSTTALDPASQRYVDAMRQQAQSGANVALAGPHQMGGQGGLFGAMNGRMSQMQGGGGPGGNSWFTGPQQMSVGDQAAQFMNPYQQNVIGAVQGQYDTLRQNALNNTRQQATLGGGFGGSRMAVLAGERLGQLDQGQAGTVAGLLHGGYQNALSQGTQYAEHQRQLQQQQLQEPLWRQQQAQAFQHGGMGPTGWTSTQTQPGGSLIGTVAGLGMSAYGAGMFDRDKPGGYQSAPQFGMPQPWQAPQWNPQYPGMR